MKCQAIHDLLLMSHSAGRRLELIQGGGGNSSVKTREGKIYIKASGTLMKDMSEEEGYTVLHRRTGKPMRQFANRRPSMEWPMHLFLPTYVLHTHPVYVNVFNCMRGGEKILLDIFANLQPLYIHYRSPGNALAIEIQKEVERYVLKNAKQPGVLFLENHGLITCGDDARKVARLTHLISVSLQNVLSHRIKRFQPFVGRSRSHASLPNRSFFPDSAVFLAAERVTSGMKEIFAANAYIEKMIHALRASPRYLSKREVYHVQHMETEQFRIAVAGHH